MATFIPPTLGSEAIFNIGSFEVRNTLITAVLTLLLLTIVGLVLRRKKYALVPGGFQNFIETIIETLFDFFDSVVGDRKKTERFFQAPHLKLQSVDWKSVTRIRSCYIA